MHDVNQDDLVAQRTRQLLTVVPDSVVVIRNYWVGSNGRIPISKVLSLIAIFYLTII